MSIDRHCDLGQTHHKEEIAFPRFYTGHYFYSITKILSNNNRFDDGFAVTTEGGNLQAL